MGTEGNKILGIQAVRGLAAICIMLYHYTFRYGCSDYFPRDYEMPINFYYGSYFVCFFFVLSSFFLFRSMHSREVRPLEYVYNRLTRLYPAFWFAVIISFLILLLFDSPLQISISEMFANLTMISPLFGVEYLDGAYWTLTYELILLFFMTIFLVTKLKNKPKWIVFGWLVLGAVSKISLNALGLDQKSSLAAAAFAFKYCHYFVLGIILYLFLQKFEKWHIAAFAAVLAYNALVDLTIASYLFLIGFTLLIILLFKKNIPGLNNRVFLFLGTISYPLYLIHEHVGFAIIQQLEAMGWKHWTNIMVPVAVSILLASAIHYFMESPLIRQFNKLKPKLFRKGAKT